MRDQPSENALGGMNENAEVVLILVQEILAVTPVDSHRHLSLCELGGNWFRRLVEKTLPLRRSYRSGSQRRQSVWEAGCQLETKNTGVEFVAFRPTEYRDSPLLVEVWWLTERKWSAET